MKIKPVKGGVQEFEKVQRKPNTAGKYIFIESDEFRPILKQMELVAPTIIV